MNNQYAWRWIESALGRRFTGSAALSAGLMALVLGCDSSPEEILSGASGLLSENGENNSSMVQRGREPKKGKKQGKNKSASDARAARFPEEFRSIDGRGNNEANPEWGAAGEAFLRLAPPQYADAASEPAGAGRINPRAVSNAVVAQSVDIANSRAASDYLWQWGQFLDHDIDETPVATPVESLDIVVPSSDSLFDPNGTGAVTIPFDRSSYLEIDGVREQVNQISAYIDASNVYGSDAERADVLRTHDGTGQLATSAGDLLPFNTHGLENAPSPAPHLFIAGDIRANEQAALTAMHTVFVREHNHWADLIALENPDFSGNRIYEYARAIVGAEMAAITYREFLPLLLGADALPDYRGYDPDLNAGITNEFATAAFRLGHSMLSPMVMRLASDGSVAASGHLPLREAFFNPNHLVQEGVESILRGLAAQPAQRVDDQVIDDVRNFLFGPPGAGGFDLVALNIQRGRDHGLVTLNELRLALGLEPHPDFQSLTSDAATRSRLAASYAHVDEVELWIGGLAEDHAPGAMVGETWRAVLVEQFTRLRDGDRFWYEEYLPPDWVELIEDQTLARILQRNTEIGDELSDDVFRVSTP